MTATEKTISQEEYDRLVRKSLAWDDLELRLIKGRKELVLLRDRAKRNKDIEGSVRLDVKAGGLALARSYMKDYKFDV